MHRLHSVLVDARLSTSALLRRRGWAAHRVYRAASTDQAADATAQLTALDEVKLAKDLADRGLRSQAVPYLERAIEICVGSTGEDSALTRAALHRLAVVLYDDDRFGAAESTLLRLGPGAAKPLPPRPAELLLLSKAQLFQGKVSSAVGSCSTAVDMLQTDEDHTPDTEALGQALRQLGSIQMLEGAEDEAETSLLRAVRLGSTAASQVKGLAALAAFNAARRDERSVEEAVELWAEACSISPDESEEGDEIDTAASGVHTDKAFRLARASVLCSSAQGGVILQRETAVASERLTEALKIRQELLPTDHPAMAWTLALLARCHLEAGEAVTAEGLFRAALDSLGGAVGEEDRGSEGQGAKANALFPSPIHPYTRAATLGGYAELLLQWEKREREGKIAAQRAESVQSSLPLKPPGGLTIHMLHLDDVY